MNNAELDIYSSFTLVVRNLLNNKAKVESELFSFHQLGYEMSIKVHYIRIDKDHLPENLGGVSEEQSERFHHDFRTMKEE